MKTTTSSSSGLVIDTSTHRSNQNLHASSTSPPVIMPGQNATFTVRSPPPVRAATANNKFITSTPSSDTNKRSDGSVSIPVEVNGNHVHQGKSTSAGIFHDKFEVPLPFGFHMDLDFVRFCSDQDLSSLSEETLSRLRELRRQRRKQRKTLEALMGVRKSQQQQQQLKVTTSASVTRYATTPTGGGGRGRGRTRESNHLAIGNRKISPSNLVISVGGGGRSRSANSNYLPYSTATSSACSSGDEFASEVLRDAVQDFELHLERTKEDERERERAVAPIKTAKFNTFPRSLSSPAPEDGERGREEERREERTEMGGGGNQTSTFKMFRQPSNSSISSLSTISSSQQQQQQQHMHNGLMSSSVHQPHHYASPSSPAVLSAVSVPANLDSSADDSESIASITSEMSTAALRNVREQMARSLAKLREYEQQVEVIPVMQARLSVLREEKRLLMLRLKQREMQLRRERGEEEEEEEDCYHNANGGNMTESEGMTGLDYDTEDDDDDTEVEGGGKGGGRKFYFQDAVQHQRQLHQHLSSPGSRARSESPYARGGIINPEEFISIRKKLRSSSACGYNSDSDLLVNPMRANWRLQRQDHHQMLQQGRLAKSKVHANLSTHHLREAEEDSEAATTPVPDISRRQEDRAPPRRPNVETREAATLTDPVPDPPPKVVEVIRRATPPPSPPPPPETRDRSVNTDPPPPSPPPPARISQGSNTPSVRMVGKSASTELSMENMVSRQEMENRIQEAVFRTEEEIMGCPLLQRAMVVVEEEAINGPRAAKQPAEMSDAGCQVGEQENLRPFVISVGLQCKLDESRPIVVQGDSAEAKIKSIDPEKEKVVRSIGVGECKLVEDPAEPARYRDAAVCTEKWVEVIKASKQTDTEDFAFKDTESPRVADLFRFEPSPERVVLERRSSLRRGAVPPSMGSPSMSRKSSSCNSPTPSRKSSSLVKSSSTKSQGTMTPAEPTKPTRDAKVGAAPATKSVSTSAMALPPALANLPAPGSPLPTPDREKPPVNICDKCDYDIHRAAKGVLQGLAEGHVPPPPPPLPAVLQQQQQRPQPQQQQHQRQQQQQQQQQPQKKQPPPPPPKPRPQQLFLQKLNQPSPPPKPEVQEKPSPPSIPAPPPPPPPAVANQKKEQVSLEDATRGKSDNLHQTQLQQQPKQQQPSKLPILQQYQVQQQQQQQKESEISKQKTMQQREKEQQQHHKEEENPKQVQVQQQEPEKSKQQQVEEQQQQQQQQQQQKEPEKPKEEKPRERETVSPKKIELPSPDMPWLSKIPRPVTTPDSPKTNRLKSASSTSNLSTSADGRSKSPATTSSSSSSGSMQRSKSSLVPSSVHGRRLMSPGSLSRGSPIPMTGRRDAGTPPPYRAPATPPLGAAASGAAVRRVSSPLARSQSPHAPVAPNDSARRSLIPKLSPAAQRRQIAQPSSTSTSSSLATTPNAAEVKSLIPRVVTPPALRKMYPKQSDKLAVKDRQVTRKNTYTKISVGLNKELVESPSSSAEGDKVSSTLAAVKEKEKKETEREEDKKSSEESGKGGSDTDSVSDEEGGAKRKKSGLSSGGFPLPGAALFTPIDENRPKKEPSKEMRSALKVLNDSLSKGGSSSSATASGKVTNAVNIIQQEWFRTSSTKQSNPLDVEDYLDAIEGMTDKGPELLARVVNMTDVNGNTALHYSVSHGNFDVVSVLLDSKVANPNVLNKAGYTCIMLVSLAKPASPTHRSVIARLFSSGDVNVRAAQHGQTALMLAAAHGRAEMVELLVSEAEADVNVRDEDGSTALMCAAEHGHMDIVRFLLQQPETNVLAKDNDGLTALAVAMEAGHRDVGVVLYANMSFSRGASPYSSMRIKRGATASSSNAATPTPSAGAGAAASTSRTSTPGASSRSSSSTRLARSARSPIVPTPPLRTRRNSNQ